MKVIVSTPMSPVSPANDDSNFEYFPLRNMLFKDATKITDTLQGSIWRTIKKSTTSVIKVTNKNLHKNAKAFVDGVTYDTQENIGREQEILKYLTRQRTCPETIIKHYGFYQNHDCYFLEMEDGGGSLFSFVERAHKLIEKGTIDLSHWKQITRVIAKQMIESVAYIHSKNICHFDISLENFLINDVHIYIHSAVDQKDKILFDLKNIHVKLCDFGLAEYFKTNRCKSDRFCGKTGYYSPELCYLQPFDAKKNDVWALGISLFMMISGIYPWKVAKKSDDAFGYFLKYSLVKLLQMWNITSYFDNEFKYLLHAIFQYEDKRISIQRVQKYIDRYM